MHLYPIILVAISCLYCQPTRSQSATPRVIITAPQGYAQRLEKALQEKDIATYSCPMIETKVLPEEAKMNQFLKEMQNYDYIAFSSRKAIESFSIALAKHPEAKLYLQQITLCAIGKDAEFLKKELKISDVLLPDEASPMGIVAILKTRPDISGKRIAVLVPWVKDIPEPDVVPDFMRALQAIQMQVTRIDAYTTCASEENIQNRFAELIRTKTASCLVFTSGAEIEVALQTCKKHHLSTDSLEIACFGPYTAAYARKKGLKVSIVAQDFSAFTGLATAIHQYYQNKK